MALLLNLLKVDNIMEKLGNKWDIIYLNSLKYLKIIFILLIKLIAIYIRFFWINF